MDLIRRPLHPRVQRRRDLAHSLGFPAELRERFSKLTGGELAALKIISSEVVRHGACTLGASVRRTICTASGPSKATHSTDVSNRALFACLAHPRTSASRASSER
jgi:hypothetical protein